MRREYHLSIQSGGTLALPADLRKRHQLDAPGSQVRLVERDDGMIELHPLVAVPADQRWIWTERWQEMEGEVDDHRAAGRVAVFDDVDDFLASLEE